MDLPIYLQIFLCKNIVVCHEPEFYEDWVTKVWNVEEWSQLQNA